MAKSSRDLLDEARRLVPEVTPQQLRDAGARTVIDVRERNEFEEGHIPGALHLSKGFIETRIEDAVPGHATPLTLYCASGIRSLLAARALGELG
ncbi:MAG TPA: rhodanese-like domain-containing protein, partial [Candidatus Dormibacteraeota bacterium]|nr:rhodanese-like domain-containing protein [Candidatus Dormibacteraeota bacterium]